MAEFSITELAREFDVTPRTIRFYEDEGLLSPRRRGQARIFSGRDRVRLQLILRGKRLGFSLSEIRDIIDMYSAEPGEAGQMRYLLQRIEERRAALQRQREDIAVTLTEMKAVELRCRHRLAELEPDAPEVADLAPLAGTSGDGAA
jgi:DNA-binding transcriptional MerR regulator